MNSAILSYRIFPLGDAAVTVDFGNIIDETINRKILNLFYQLRDNPLQGMTEVVPAYSSITVYYNIFETSKKFTGIKSAFDFISGQLNERLGLPLTETAASSSHVSIPVCYDKEFAPDIEYLAMEKNISVDELVHIHTSKQYRVFMLGFLPGFSYLGEVDERIAIPRKSQPVTVTAGSIGIAGRQTGIYPLSSPGGWQIIGRTPLKLFDAEKEDPVLLKAGDSVQFTPISKDEFKNY